MIILAEVLAVSMVEIGGVQHHRGFVWVISRVQGLQYERRGLGVLVVVLNGRYALPGAGSKIGGPESQVIVALTRVAGAAAEAQHHQPDSAREGGAEASEAKAG